MAIDLVRAFKKAVPWRKCRAMSDVVSNRALVKPNHQAKASRPQQRMIFFRTALALLQQQYGGEPRAKLRLIARKQAKATYRRQRAEERLLKAKAAGA